MSSELKVFKSFNCSVCESPFSKSRNGPKYPSQLYCGKAVCGECWKEGIRLELQERKYHCEPDFCCFSDSGSSPSFLIDYLLNNLSIIESPNGNGYLLWKPKNTSFQGNGYLGAVLSFLWKVKNQFLFTNPLMCPKCDVKYSMEKDQNKPVVLRCGHPICTRCYLKHRKVTSDPEWYKMNCSICNGTDRYHSLMERRDNWFREFLRELPELVEQIPQVLQSLWLFGLFDRIVSTSTKRLVGRGAFGEVFQVIDHQPPVAIKYINCPNETQIDRFQRECGVLRKLKHKNVVTLLDSGSIKGSTQFGIVMEFCERGTLKKAILNPKFIYTMKTVIFWGEELFDALDYMFKEHKVVHRDIKPDNIFVDEEFVLKIGDFGCIKYTEQTCSGSFVGTPRYMSPPEFDGYKETIQDSHRNDVYSMGLVLWEMIERRIVLSEYNNEQGQFMRDHFTSDLYQKKITKLPSPNCQRKLQKIVAKCTNFDRSLRPVASDIYEELKKYAGQSFSNWFMKLQRLPFEKENQVEIIKPLGFNGTMDKIPIETAKNSSDDLDLDLNVKL